VGQHIPKHGKPRHLHAAPLSVPRAAETDSSTSELSSRRQQHGGEVISDLNDTTSLVVDLIVLSESLTEDTWIFLDSMVKCNPRCRNVFRTNMVRAMATVITR